MVYSKLFFFCLGFGSGIIGMSLVKKLFRRKRTKRSSSNETVMSATLKEVSEKGLLDSPETGQPEAVNEHTVVTSSSSASTNSDSSINQTLRETRRKLNSTLRKYRKTEKKLHRKKCEILQMENEIENLMQTIKNSEMQMESLQEEFNNKKLEMVAITSYITPDSETEIKKREILCYKRYSNIKTASDAKSVMTMIRQRQKALKTLEILTFKKYWSILQKKELNSEKSPGFRVGMQNWFKAPKNNNNTSESNQESQPTSQDEDDGGFINPFYMSLVDATV